MARNEEKHYGKLNRLILFKEKQEYEKKNPKRPRLNTLDTPEDIQKWIPSIKQDLEFYLKKSQVTCYSDAHIEECKVKINNLEKEFKSFVRKISQLTPGKLEAVPWTHRAYKRKACGEPTSSPASNKEFVRITTPILDIEKVLDQLDTVPVIDSPSMDLPLVFVDKAQSQLVDESMLDNKALCDNDSKLEYLKVNTTNFCPSTAINSNSNVHSSMKTASEPSDKMSLVKYDYSSDNDS